MSFRQTAYGSGESTTAILHFPGSCFMPVDGHEKYDKQYLENLAIYSIFIILLLIIFLI